MYDKIQPLASNLTLGEADTHSDAKLYRKVAWRLIPLLFICYVVAYLDRINVGFAKLQMQDALGFSDTVYGLGAGIFFIGYFLFEVPSNMILERIGAKRTIARIMICWGVVGCLMAHVSTPTGFYVLRFLLGVFEAGFFPGVVYYLGCWFPESRRGHMLGIFMTGIPIAGLFGGPVSGWAMSSLSGFGMQGWQWLYIIEAAPAVLLGFVAIAYLDDSAAKAKWLTSAERDRLSAALAAESQRNSARADSGLRTAMTSPRLYALAFAYFAFICGTYAVSFWLPTLLKSSGVTNLASIGWYSAIPYGLSAAGMVWLCRRSDRTMERRLHTSLAAIAGAVALGLLPYIPTNVAMTLALLTVAATGIFATMPLFWSIATDYFAGTPSAAVAIAFINSLGLIGGFASPFAMGWLKTVTGSLTSGLYLVTAVVLLGAITLILFAPRSMKKA
ncbi:permease (plasmid) [Burkholderia sp. SFA1]|uniref:MFS transporter n=1 Tax=unclassified Caballeronia TaxID=2646786 RepID=UPI001F2F12AB|nr:MULTISPECIES: MFS transporter [unclassified Caballeronia]MCE4546980.1 MFS transporter [Caballeronia sp. PC1]MCE4572547.1 MFS transporter [Caballeronia sp. CLC5]BBQ02080.1 permease [Burkholderia sp. SFA1]